MTAEELLSMRCGEFASGALCREGIPACACLKSIIKKWPRWLVRITERETLPLEFNEYVQAWWNEQDKKEASE